MGVSDVSPWMPLVVSLAYYLREIQAYYPGPGKVPKIQVLSMCTFSVFRRNRFFNSLHPELLENSFQNEDFCKPLPWCYHVCRKPLFLGPSLLFGDIFCVPRVINIQNFTCQPFGTVGKTLVYFVISHKSLARSATPKICIATC